MGRSGEATRRFTPPDKKKIGPPDNAKGFVIYAKLCNVKWKTQPAVVTVALTPDRYGTRLTTRARNA